MSENDILVKVEGASKKFCRDLKRSLWYGVQDIGAELLGRHKNGQLRKDEFWAVEDVSFELKRGECLGLIGHNGAGKSTLLKMLNGLITPDKGRITMKGRVGALIELGAGFNPILTGRENIYNNGIVLGFSRKDIDKKFDAIVDFADIGDFIDTPVQNYSSGMKVRLGFGVAVQLKPDVLLIDEVLAVGDISFQMKCYNAINEMLKKTAVIFVSHNVQQVARLCDKVLQLDRGKVKYLSSNIYEGIEHYLDSFYQSINSKASILNKDIEVEVEHFMINNKVKSEPIVIDYGNHLSMMLNLNCSKYHSNISFGVAVNDRSLRPVAFFVSDVFELAKGKSTVTFNSYPLYLNKGTYFLTLIISRFENPEINDKREILVRYDDLVKIRIEYSIKILLPAAYFIDGTWEVS